LKTRHQLLLDNLVAKPLAFILNIFVRIAGKIFRIDHSLQKDFHTIVICKFKGMGSIIQSTPMIEVLRNRFPQAEIIYVSTAGNRQILEKISTIDTIITVNDTSAFRLLHTSVIALFRLIKKRPEIYIDLEIYSNFSTLFTLFTFSKNRIGFYLRSSSFRMGIYTQMMFFNPKVSISEVYLQIARLFGKTTCQPSLYPLFSKIEQNKFSYSEPFIVINPNASDLRIERRWAKQQFIQLINLILLHFPAYTIYLTGSSSEQAYTKALSDEIQNDKLQNLAGKISIDELIFLISKATLMITNDTGPMHIAFSSKTPSICLFGPCSPDQYGHHANSMTIYKRVYCSPCVHDFIIPPCKGNNVCMKLITSEEVFAVVQNFLMNTSSIQNNSSEVLHYESDGEVLGLVNR